MLIIFGLLFVSVLVGHAENYTTEFFSEFNDLTGWTNTDPEEFYLLDSTLYFAARKGDVQHLYYPISILGEDFRIRARFKMTGNSANCFVNIGLAREVYDIHDSNSLFDNSIFICPSYTAGSNYGEYHISGFHRDAGGSNHSISEGGDWLTGYDGFKNLSTDTWYIGEIIVSDTVWTLTLYDDALNMLYQANNFCPNLAKEFNYVYIGNPTDYNFEYLYGELDWVHVEVAEPGSGLVAYYPFNGNANDESGNGNDGVEYGATLTNDRFGAENSAYSLNGLDNFIELPATCLNNINNGTVTVWVNTADISNQQKILWKGWPEHGASDYVLAIDNGDHTIPGAIGVWTLDSEGPWDYVGWSQNPVQMNHWHFITHTWDGSAHKIYIDGHLTDEFMSTRILRANLLEPVIVGGLSSTGSSPPDMHFFNGKVDDIRVYDIALQGAEIDSLFHLGGWPIPEQMPVLAQDDKEGTRLVIPSGQETLETSFTLKNIGDIPADFTLEMVSSDSTWILYADEPDVTVTFDGNIWKMRPDGSQKTQLTFETKDRDPVWSPDGTRIAFYSFRGEAANPDIWIMNSDGTGLTNLTNDAGVFDAEPDWSPDGQWLFYRSTRDNPSGDIYKINIDTREIIRLTEDVDSQGRPKVSPDGRQFACFTKTWGQRADIRVYSIADGSYKEFGGPSDDYQVDWMPDGKRVIWSLRNENGILDLVSARPDGSDLRLELSTEFNKYYPRMSPDGHYIAFPASVNTAGGGDEIMIHNRAFHGIRTITGNTIPNSEWGPDWSGCLSSPEWVMINQTGGQLEPGAEQTVNVTLDVSMLPPGDHTASVIARDVARGQLLAVCPINIRISDDLRPQILAVMDVPEDQGNWVEVQWQASALDGAGEITQYGIWERNLFGEWVVLGSSPAIQRFRYKYLARTYMNSSVMIDYYNEFRVIAHTSDAERYFTSESGFGTSWDNLVPAAPTSLAAWENNDQIYLQWDASIDEDFNFFRVYRSQVEDFATMELISELIETSFIDPNVEVGETYYYRVSAVDFNANEGEPSETVTHSVVGIDTRSMPDVFTLENAYPNPFNPITTIRYGLPEASDVLLTIYDVSGREVITLVQQSQPSGWYSISWNGQNQDGTSVGTGIYLAKIQASQYSEVIKMVYLK
ncbi:MAG: T9SS type A sorting domain-containing protein [Candidatus Marinimicrobia bacterium]|nr:T9SS type A sorting domain-containing protein [Candidatus Neomarinimicrobiota bacterium]